MSVKGTGEKRKTDQKKNEVTCPAERGKGLHTMPFFKKRKKGGGGAQPREKKREKVMTSTSVRGKGRHSRGEAENLGKFAQGRS